MTQDEIIHMVYEACGVIYKPFPGVSIGMTHEHLERFAALVTEATKEKIIDEWCMCVDADLEHGIKSLNERAWAKWKKEYPNVSKFAESVEKLK